ncbi:MAG: hypothetical protein Q4G13_09300, partial [Moraxella sp.]|nr:hypothetical protein [Moraxella sp.]
EAAQDTTQDNAEPANNPSTSAKNATSKDTSASIQSTKPMTYHWFLLGDYDRKRRLPAAPFLPDYTASALLYTPVMSEELS